LIDLLFFFRNQYQVNAFDIESGLNIDQWPEESLFLGLKGVKGIIQRELIH
jgi:hypothetical protein